METTTIIILISSVLICLAIEQTGRRALEKLQTELSDLEKTLEAYKYLCEKYEKHFGVIETLQILTKIENDIDTNP